MRVQSQVAMKNGGWFHPNGTTARYAPPEPERPKVSINVRSLMDRWVGHPISKDLQWFANHLGVGTDSLLMLNCVWAGDDHKAYAFPMSNGEGDWVGIRLRAVSGKKWAVKGSSQGLFIPRLEFKRDLLWICEGPTDTAAALTMGLYAVGRPSCSGGVRDLNVLVRRWQVPRVVIVSDNDKPGLSGADVLTRHLPCPTATLVLPTKDMREFYKQGGNVKVLGSLLKTVIWSNK